MRNANNASFILGNSSEVLFKIDEFPSGKNELPLLFSIYSNLSQTRIAELMTDEKDKDKISSLFEKYEKINNELFTISEKETRKNEKMFLEFENHESSDGWGRYRWRNDDDSSNKIKRKISAQFISFIITAIFYIAIKSFLIRCFSLFASG